jgi:hypothetical protein
MGVTAWAAAHRPARAHSLAAAPVAARPTEAPPADRPAPSVVVPSDVPSFAAVYVDAANRVASCDAAFAQRDWTAIASTCAAAFEARPEESALAMRVAQAQHRRGHIADAAVWARKALALDADIPEALVIVAHGERGAGHPRAAAEAYRRYLTLAPRGWHAAEARRALRAER